MKKENEYIVQCSGDGNENGPLFSVTINQYWDKEEIDRENDSNQKGAA